MYSSSYWPHHNFFIVVLSVSLKIIQTGCTGKGTGECWQKDQYGSYTVGSYGINTQHMYIFHARQCMYLFPFLPVLCIVDILFHR